MVKAAMTPVLAQIKTLRHRIERLEAEKESLVSQNERLVAEKEDLMSRNAHLKVENAELAKWHDVLRGKLGL
jgi:predicted nuclease with TOPRIM domain